MSSSQNDDKMDSIIQLLKNQRAFQEEMRTRIANLEARVMGHNGVEGNATNNSTLQTFTRTSMKLDMPRFNG
ncbi:unnamed protein product, partial [Sphenostylis stenocarpa]